MIKLVGLVLFSHGSLLCGSGRALDAHADRLRGSGQYVAVEPGYLNYTLPAVETAVQRCVDAGAKIIVISPYFLVAGKFVQQDLPRRMASIVPMFPEIRFVMGQALEDIPMMEDAVIQVELSAQDTNQWQQVAVEKALQLCELREDCPLYGTKMCRSADGSDTTVQSGGGDSSGDIEAAADSKALMIILHGSPRAEANEPARKLAENFMSTGRFSKVVVAYLECNTPSIPEALAECANAGVGHVVAVPYFLHAGRHLVLDIPELLIEGTARYPQMIIQMCDAVGTSPLIAEALATRASEVI